MKGKTRIGIDPGKQGFLAVYTLFNDNEDLNFYPIPLIGKEIDIYQLNRIFQGFLDSTPINDIYCVIENVHAIYGSSAEATFSFGFCCGILESLLVAHNIPYTKVAPKKWQKEMWEGIPLQQKSSSTGKTQVTDTKLMSLLAAKRIFPNVDLRESVRCKKPNDGKVDALLMMEYCKRNF